MWKSYQECEGAARFIFKMEIARLEGALVFAKYAAYATFVSSMRKYKGERGKKKKNCVYKMYLEVFEPLMSGMHVDTVALCASAFFFLIISSIG